MATKIGTNTIGRAAGRAIPGIGWGICYYDVATYSYKAGKLNAIKRKHKPTMLSDEALYLSSFNFSYRS